MDDPRVLLSGDHTRGISRPTPKSGGIVGFAKIRETCLGCRAPLSPGGGFYFLLCFSFSEKVLCSHCQADTPAIFTRYLSEVRQKEMEFSRLWTQCQQCQGSYHQEVLCSA